MKYKWNDSLSIGHEDVDNQHKVIFRAAEKLETAVASGESAETVSKLVRFLEEYAFKHFDTEESYMESIGYSRMAEHVKQHEAFRSRVQEISSKLDKGTDYSEFLDMAVLDFLGQWLTTHIKGMDTHIGLEAGTEFPDS